MILATARQFSGANADFFEIFGEKIDYFEKIGRISDGRSLRLWVTNYCSWVADYSRGRLDVSRADAVTRAKHYVIEHYQNPSLTLKAVSYTHLSPKQARSFRSASAARSRTACNLQSSWRRLWTCMTCTC